MPLSNGSAETIRPLLPAIRGTVARRSSCARPSILNVAMRYSCSQGGAPRARSDAAPDRFEDEFRLPFAFQILCADRRAARPVVGHDRIAQRSPKERNPRELVGHADRDGVVGDVECRSARCSERPVGEDEDPQLLVARGDVDLRIGLQPLAERIGDHGVVLAGHLRREAEPGRRPSAGVLARGAAVREVAGKRAVVGLDEEALQLERSTSPIEPMGGSFPKLSSAR